MVYIDFDNQLGFALKQLRFKSRSVYTRYTNRNSKVYGHGSFVRYNWSGLDSKMTLSRRAGKALTREALTIEQSKT